MDAKFDMVCKFGLVMAAMNVSFSVASLISINIEALMGCYVCISCMTFCGGLASLV